VNRPYTHSCPFDAPPILGHTLRKSIPYADRGSYFDALPILGHTLRKLIPSTDERSTHIPRRGADPAACQLVHTPLESTPHAEKAYGPKAEKGRRFCAPGEEGNGGVEWGGKFLIMIGANGRDLSQESSEPVGSCFQADLPGNHRASRMELVSDSFLRRRGCGLMLIQS
jgi:hypothetical protein